MPSLASRKYNRHELSHTAEYAVYGQMLQRCTNPSNSHWQYYGGRGIRVCDRWLENFAAFYEDMGPRPSPQHQINRIDNDGDYSPDNCEWTTRSQNSRNRSNNARVDYAGRSWCLVELAEHAGLNYHTLYDRIFRFGWGVEEAVATPPRPLRRSVAVIPSDN